MRGRIPSPVPDVSPGSVGVSTGLVWASQRKVVQVMGVSTVPTPGPIETPGQEVGVWTFGWSTKEEGG